MLFWWLGATHQWNPRSNFSLIQRELSRSTAEARFNLEPPLIQPREPWIYSIRFFLDTVSINSLSSLDEYHASSHVSSEIVVSWICPFELKSQSGEPFRRDASWNLVPQFTGEWPCAHCVAYNNNSIDDSPIALPDPNKNPPSPLFT